MCVEAAQPLRLGLREARPLRRRQHDRQRRPRSASIASSARKHRLRLQHHPRPAAVRHIVHHPVPVGREVPQVADLHVQRAALDRPAEHARRQRLLDHRRKNRDDVEGHAFTSSNPSGGSITIRFAAGSIVVQIAATSGISTSPPAAATTSRLPLSVPSTSCDRPDRLARPRLDPAADQVVPVERAARQRRQPIDRHPQLPPRQRLGVVHRLDAGNPDDRDDLDETGRSSASAPERLRSAR